MSTPVAPVQFFAGRPFVAPCTSVQLVPFVECHRSPSQFERLQMERVPLGCAIVKPLELPKTTPADVHGGPPVVVRSTWLEPLRYWELSFDRSSAIARALTVVMSGDEPGALFADVQFPAAGVATVTVALAVAVVFAGLVTESR